MSQVAVLGAGSWGTAFALVLADAGHDVALWARRTEVAAAVEEQRTNPEYLPGVALPESIRATSEVAAALAGAELVAVAVPAQALRASLAYAAPELPGDAVLVSLAKGVERVTLQRMSEVIAEAGGVGRERIAVLTGPNLSREIAERQPAGAVIAAEDAAVSSRLQAMCHTPTFRPYTSTDVVGCELGGATKNVIAIAVGLALGMGFGDNATATVVTRGLAEIARLGRALGADPYTFSGLAGLGDLVATCSSPLSRNRRFGELLATGQSVADIAAATRQVAEGATSCESISRLAARHDVEMPIVEQVAALVRGEIDPKEAMGRLLARAAKPERW